MNSFWVYFLFIILYFWLVWKSGKTYPIIYLFIFTYFLQYIFSTYLIYNEYKVLSYQMPIHQDKYFEYTVIALLSLFSGIFLFNKDIDLRPKVSKIEPEKAKNLGYLLLGISYGFDFVQLVGIEFLNSIISFTTYLKYLAAFCFLFSTVKIRFIIIAVVFIQLALSVIKGGVFISFFIWSTFLFFFISLRYKFSFTLRATFLLVAVPVLVLIQGVKEKYREETWRGRQEGGVQVFTDLAVEESEKNEGEPFAESKGVISTVARLTQGWHLGMTLKHVPNRQKFAGGEEMMGDVSSSIIPRVFFPDKKMVNSQDKFYKYTGHKLMGNTSMSIGVLGDFYINYGEWGSYVMLFVFGVLIIKSYNWFIRRFVFQNPLNIVWIPFILSYLIRANNDFYIFFNGMIKGFILFLIVDYVQRRIWARPAPVRKTVHA